MMLGYTLILISVIGMIYGIVKKNKVSLIASVILLLFVIVVYLIYSYLYSLNPY